MEGRAFLPSGLSVIVIDDKQEGVVSQGGEPGGAECVGLLWRSG